EGTESEADTESVNESEDEDEDEDSDDKNINNKSKKEDIVIEELQPKVRPNKINGTKLFTNEVLNELQQKLSKVKNTSNENMETASLRSGVSKIEKSSIQFGKKPQKPIITLT